jgi:hypothetical protein
MKKFVLFVTLLLSVFMFSGCKFGGDEYMYKRPVAYYQRELYSNPVEQKYEYYLMFDNDEDKDRGEYFFVQVYPERDILGRDIEQIYSPLIPYPVCKKDILYLDDIKEK